MAQADLFSALSARSTGTVGEVIQSPTPASLGPPSVASSTPPPKSTLERSTRIKDPVTSERAALGIQNPEEKKRTASPASVSASSASDLSRIEKSRRRRRSKHRSHRRDSSSSSESRHRRSRSHRKHSKRDSSSSSSESEKRKKKHHKKQETAPAASPPAPVVEEVDECGRCSKPRFVDPLDPALANLSAKKKERIRVELIRRIQKLKRDNPGEGIQLPVRGLDDPVVCYRRYRRVVRHLYAKRSIVTYQFMVAGFLLLAQVVLSKMFGPAANEYLKTEFDNIEKYNEVFYQMGCRAYSPYGGSACPEYQFAWKLVAPILIIVATYFISRYTPVPPIAIGMFNSMASSYLKNETSANYRTLLHDEDDDEPDDESSSDEDEPVVVPKQRAPRVDIPRFEEDLPEENIGMNAIRVAAPAITQMLSSVRPNADGTQSPQDPSIVGTLLNMMQAFTGGGNRQAAAPTKTEPAPAVFTD